MNWLDYWTFYNVGVGLFALAGVFLLVKWIFMKKGRKSSDPEIRFRHWREHFEQTEERLQDLLVQYPALPKEAAKLLRKQHKKDRKQEQKKNSEEQRKLTQEVRNLLESGKSSKEVLQQHSNRIYVLDFKGDVMAKAVAQLREEITLLLKIAQPSDEIVLRLSSPGGAVAQYGLASSQVARLKHAGLRCVACIDVVAASGGYMMATVSDHIVAAPFAFIGSIGVVAGMPNFHRLLKKNEVDYHLLTAGKYKRTLTPFSEVQEEHREKLQADLEAIHEAFKNLVAEHRPQLDIEAVATGEVWLGSQALERGLVDELGTSDDYLMKKTEAGCEVILVSTEQPQSPLDKILQLPQAIQNRWSLPDSPESAFWGHSPHS